MITDTDIKKMKKVFATKDDLKQFATKNDLKGLAKQKDLLRVESKVDILDKRVTFVESKVDTVKSTLDELVGAVGAIFEWTDDIHRAIVGKPAKRSHGN